MRSPRLLPLALLLAASSGSFAQVVPPDAGQVLNTLRPVVPQAPAKQRLEIAVPAEPAKGAPSGPAVVVSAVSFEGNSVFSAEVLRALIAAELGKKHDLEGLRALARVDDPDAQGWETRRCVEAITRLFEVQA